jgi:hypothetical protein
MLNWGDNGGKLGSYPMDKFSLENLRINFFHILNEPPISYSFRL